MSKTITYHFSSGVDGEKASYYIDGEGPYEFKPSWSAGTPGVRLQMKPWKPSRVFFLMLDKETGTTWLRSYVDKKEKYLQRYRRRGERMKKGRR